MGVEFTGSLKDLRNSGQTVVRSARGQAYESTGLLWWCVMCGGWESDTER